MLDPLARCKLIDFNPGGCEQPEELLAKLRRELALDDVGVAGTIVRPIGWPPTTLDVLTGCLSDRERARAARFLRPQDRLVWMAGHGLKRFLLSAVDPAVSPETWQFVQTDRGKPFIAAPEHSLTFNLSHTGNAAGAAVHVQPIGFDLEDDSRPVEPSVAEAHFSADERRYLGPPGTAEWRRRFYEVWTMKEAYLKATGRGIVDGLAGITCRPLQDRQWMIQDATAQRPNLAATCWHARSFELRGGLRAAVVAGSDAEAPGMDDAADRDRVRS